jgi:hypothetical protein
LPKDDTTPPVMKTKRVIGASLWPTPRRSTIQSVRGDGPHLLQGRHSATGGVGGLGVSGACGSLGAGTRVAGAGSSRIERGSV